MKVGTKELKNRLSYYLRQVRAGERVYVADRSEIVAELRRVDPARSLEEKSLRELAGRGMMTLGRGKSKDFRPLRIRRGISASRIVIQGRG